MGENDHQHSSAMFGRWKFGYPNFGQLPLMFQVFGRLFFAVISPGPSVTAAAIFDR